jgi:3-hydroxyacyl-[acyl-carrier-protein] dehydratase
MTAPAPPVDQRLRALLEERRISQTQLARDLAGPLASKAEVQNRRRLVIKWLNGEHRPGARNARMLADILGTDDDFFLSGPPRGDWATPLNDAVAYVRQAAQSRNGVEALAAPIHGKAKIAKILPIDRHLVLLSHIDELVAGKFVRARATMRREDWGLGEVYPGTNMVPAVLLIEALAQVGAFGLVAIPAFRHHTVLAASYDHIRFKEIVHFRVDPLVLECEFDRRRDLIARARVEIRKVVKGAGKERVVVTGRMVFALSV